MKKSLFLLIVFVIVAGVMYWQQSSLEETADQMPEPVAPIEIDVTQIDYPLDSLLNFDSEEALIAVYGKEYVGRKKGYYPEGMGEYTMTTLFADTPNEVGFMWEDDTLAFNSLMAVMVEQDSSDWRDSRGIHVGMRLKALEQINGAPFDFYGFAWDYSGLTNFEEGALKNKGVSVTMGMKEEDYQKEEYLELLGDHSMKSSDKLPQAANPIVVELTLSKSMF